MRRIFFFLLPILGFSLELQPWFGDCLEFHFLGSYAYSFFDKVQNGVPQLTHKFNSNVITLGLDFSLTPEWSFDTELQFADTTKQNFNFRSFATQARYLWFDDIMGDKVSLATGLNARFTNTDSLRDVSCPYHANFDFELNLALGKEFDITDSSAIRLWGYGAVGHANKGSPWIRAILAMDANLEEKHQLGFFGEASNGYGRHTTVLINDFNGYAKIRQKSIDLGVRYARRLGVHGTLRFAYVRRVLAKSCPQQVNAFIFSYFLPFSL